MNKLLCIVGPTGMGKTAKAIEIAQLTPSILVSADSRQVYRGMDIVTGKDHPRNINIYGTDIMDPDEPCSVAVWHTAVMPAIFQAWEAGKLVIVVGGTGLYVKSLTTGIATMQIPINQVLRDQLSSLSITKLQERLWAHDPNKFVQFNHSDQDNPRRLIRAIEIAESPYQSSPKPVNSESKTFGLKDFDTSKYRSVIRDRVIKRLELGAIDETKRLLKQYGEGFQSFSAIGYRSLIDYLQEGCSKINMIEQWITDELAYAKRQITWFNKIDQIKWYDRNITGEEIYVSTKN